MLSNEVYYPLLGQLLHERYQITQVLSSGAFGQTYIAQDITKPNNYRCVVKHQRLLYDFPDLLKTSKRILLNEAEILDKLGTHEQIPQLLACFEEDNWFYLVQELITGYTLGSCLPLKKHDDTCWSESEVVHLLRELAHLLGSVHSSGIIHCDIKPNNIIKRAQDSKFVLIDFGAAQPIRDYTEPQYTHQLPPAKSKAAAHPLGYLAPEQLLATVYPSSDFYALGMIAIQALTGLEPTQLPIQEDKGDIDWEQLFQERVLAAQVSEELIAIVMKMVSFEHQERYQSAGELIDALETHLAAPAQPNLLFEQIEHKLLSEAEKDEKELNPKAEKLATTDIIDYGIELLESAFSHFSKLPLIVTGMGVGMTVTNAIAIAVGAYSLISTIATVPELDVLRHAHQKYQDGNLFEALSIAESISDDSPLFNESRAALKTWTRQWEKAETQFAITEQAFQEERWYDVLQEGSKIPDIAYWQEKAAPFTQQAYAKTEGIAKKLLNQAFAEAKQKNFTQALVYLEQIPPETKIGSKIRPKIIEYRAKEQIRATYFLQQAYNQAQKREFQQAIGYLQRIPQQASVKEIAQTKIVEYTEKQRIREIVAKNQQLRRNETVKRAFHLNPGNQLQEVKIKPQIFPSLNWY